MSRLSTDRLCIALGAEALDFVRVSGFFKKTMISNAQAACDPHYGARPWDGALKVLQEETGKLRAQRLKVTIVLSNQFVRYAIVPADAAVSGRAEELALARFHFARIHGERAKGWELRLSEAPGNGRRLASAVDTGLIEALRACFPPGAGPRLVSIQPRLMAVFNAERARLSRDGVWLALVEHGRVCLALASREGWLAVQSVRFDAGEDLAALLERESLRCGAAPVRSARVHGAPVKEGKGAGGWQLSQAFLPLGVA